MEKPVLVIMAAGMGSRYGGLKQIEPIDDSGHIIMDYSLYDAKQAGFERVIFIIKRQNEEDFRAAIGNRMEDFMEVSYVFQDVANLPEGYQVPVDRVKPWGTAHAVLCAAPEIRGPFAVINADDFYGRDAFREIFNYLSEHPDEDVYRYAMVGYELQKTVTENGSVARGVCTVNAAGELVDIVERTQIEKRDSDIAYTENGTDYVVISGSSLVSMNMWGFTPSILAELQDNFPKFLETELISNPMKCEFFLPAQVSQLLEAHKATVAVLPSSDTWYGITYQEDKPMVEAAVKEMIAGGKYPAELWKM